MKLAILMTMVAALTAQAKIEVFETGADGFHTRNFFYDNGEEVVVFDTQFTPALAEASIRYLRTKTRNPITHVVITHPNPDKFNGAPVFQALGAKVVASRKTVEAMPGVHAYKKHFFVSTAKMFAEADYPRLPEVDVVFDDTHDLVLGNGEVIRLRELDRPGISSNQTVAFVKRERALFVGDLVHHRTHAWLEGGIVNGKATPALAGWIADLKEIARRYPRSRVHGGRGGSAPVAAAVREQVAYLEKADRLVSDYAAALGAGEPDYAALQKRFEAAFPGYAHGYLIQYGAYGLVASKR